jgi:hypothetical protein
MQFLIMAYHGFAYGVGAVVAYYVVAGVVSLIGGRNPPVA